MASSVPVPNPMWWLHYHLFGGARKLAAYAIIWCSVLLAGVLGFRYMDQQSPLASYCDGAVYVLIVIQFIILIAGGCNAIHRAIVRDVSSNMLESHRISPLGGLAIISGYVLGPTLHILVIFAVGTLFGAVLIRWGTIGVDTWLLGSGYTFIAVLLPWTGTVLLGMGRKKPINPLGILLLMMLLGFLLVLVPGLGMFTGLYALMAGASLMSGASPVVGGPNVPVSGGVALLLITVAITVIWARAALRKYRRPDLPAFGTFRAIGLLVLWLLLNALAFCGWQTLVRGNPMGLVPLGEFPIPLMLSVSVTLIIAFLPIGAAAHTRCRTCHLTLRKPLDSKISAGMLPACCGLLALTLAGFLPSDIELGTLLITALAVIASLITVEGLFVRAFATGSRPTRSILVYIVVFWLTPVIVGMWYSVSTTAASDRYYSVIAPNMIGGFSPVGAIMELFRNEGANLVPGTAFQVVVAVILAALGHRALKRRRPT